MKTNSFFLGAFLGAAATVALTKKFFSCCSCDENGVSSDNSVSKDVDAPAAKNDAGETLEKKDSDVTIEQLRNSIDSLRKELSSRIESEQTFAAKCEDLREQVAKQNAEINNLKNVCEMQDSRNKKLEEELANSAKK